jgi:hypothetical protein
VKARNRGRENMATNTLFDGDAYWNDSWVQELDGDEERLYHFYITSPNLDKSGVYKQTERSVEFYVHGLGMERIREITEKFAKAKKVIRCGEWIIVPTSLKHQSYRNNTKILTSIVEYLKKLPEEVFEALRECNYPIDLNRIRPPKQPKTDDPSLKTDEFNIIQLNSTESNSIESEFNINSSGECLFLFYETPKISFETILKKAPRRTRRPRHCVMAVSLEGGRFLISAR